MLRTVARVAFVIGLAAVVALSLLPGGAVPTFSLSDKLLHFAAYAALGLTGSIGFPRRGQRVAVLLTLPVLGLALEGAQGFTASRSPEAADAFANALGAIAGSVVAGLLERIARPG